MAAIIVLATGLLRFFLFGKGAEYYLGNGLFHVKITLFVLIGLLSIFPTRKFLIWRRQLRNNAEPDYNSESLKRTLMIIRIELLLTALIPFLAVMMSRGYGN
ncbi:MAG: DUF2214 family protein [Bacteroidales bacterium]|nr:DUF2214 family protein [Bacteroidales bacterium]